MWEFDLAVIGMGYVGLPLARAAAEAGLRVVGFDVNGKVVDTVSAGRSHIDDISDNEIEDMLAAGFIATTDPDALSRTEIICVCVPTPLSGDRGPDLTAVLAASRTIAAHITKGALVVYESTTYPGSTEKDAKPVLESNGMVAGEDFNLAFSPERVDPGNPKFGIKNTPKVVGGHTEKCGARAYAHYHRFVDRVVLAKGMREAEMAKLLENTYRHINIALVNEMAKFSHEMGIDIWDVISCAATKPFGFQAFYPGPGVGGHCIPIDPNYLSYKVQADLGYPFRFVELAQEINHGMAAYVANRCSDLLNEHGWPVNGSTVLLLGVTYKPNVADQREAPATPIARELRKRYAKILFHDPFVDTWSVDGIGIQKVDDLRRATQSADLTVLLQDHHHYDLIQLVKDARLLLDTRGKTHPNPGSLL